MSGQTVAELDEDEVHCMVESGKTVRDLKRRLSARVEYSRFEQRLMSGEIGELQDDMHLRPLPSVQLVILPSVQLRMMRRGRTHPVLPGESRG